MSEPTTVDFGAVKAEIDASMVEQSLRRTFTLIEDSAEITSLISERMRTMVQENISSGTFIPLKPETIERREYPFHPKKGAGGGAREATGSTRPLVASGAMKANIRAAHNATGFAAAIRGKDDWYAFLHDRGVGRLDERKFMTLDAGQEETVYGMYERWVDERMETDEA